MQNYTLIQSLCISLLKVPVVNGMNTILESLQCLMLNCIYQLLLNNPMKRNWIDKRGELGGDLDSEFLKINLPLKISLVEIINLSIKRGVSLLRLEL